MLISQNLHFNMTSGINNTLHIHSAISKSSLSLARSRLKSRYQIFSLFNLTDSLSATSSRSLKHNRVANFFSNFQSLFSSKNFSVRSWNNWNISLNHLSPSINLIAHHIHDCPRRTNEFHTNFLTHGCELRIFTQKSKTRVNSFSLCQNSC